MCMKCGCEKKKGEVGFGKGPRVAKKAVAKKAVAKKTAARKK